MVRSKGVLIFRINTAFPCEKYCDYLCPDKENILKKMFCFSTKTFSVY